MPKIPLLKVLASGGFVSPPVREAMVPFKVEQVGAPSVGGGRYSIAYDPDTGMLVGKLAFTCTPLPTAELDASGRLTRRSPYYGHVVVAVLKYLNSNYKNFEDADKNMFANLQWDADDIAAVQFVSETAGDVVVGKADADVYMTTMSHTAHTICEYRNQIRAFQKTLPVRRVAVTESQLGVIDAFLQHQKYAGNAGSLSLNGGILYSYGEAIAAWAGDTAVLNLAKFSHTTTVQQNAVLRALQDAHIPYTRVESTKDIYRALV